MACMLRLLGGLKVICGRCVLMPYSILPYPKVAFAESPERAQEARAVRSSP